MSESFTLVRTRYSITLLDKYKITRARSRILPFLLCKGRNEEAETFLDAHNYVVYDVFPIHRFRYLSSVSICHTLL